MITILAGGVLDTRLSDDPRLSEKQKRSLKVIAALEPDAAVKGFDQNKLPVVHLPSPYYGDSPDIALKTDGGVLKPEFPLYENWGET